MSKSDLECIFMSYDERVCNILYDSAYSIPTKKASFGLLLIEQALFESKTHKVALISPKGCSGAASYHISGDILRIWELGVVEHRLGYGSFLLDAIKDYARVKGCRKIEVMGALNNVAPFYHKNGFDPFMTFQLK